MWKAFRWALGLGAIALVVLLMLLWPVSPAKSEENRVSAAIVFVIDRSTSMKPDERQLVSIGHASALRSNEVLNAIDGSETGRIAVAVVNFASAAAVASGWTIVDGEVSAYHLAQRILAEPADEIGWGTSIAHGLYAALALLKSLPFETDKLVVDVCGDGVDTDGGFAALSQARDAVLSLGATINGLPIMLDPSDANLEAYYRDRVMGGPAAFSMPVDRIEEFPSAIRQKLLLELF